MSFISTAVASRATPANARLAHSPARFAPARVGAWFDLLGWLAPLALLGAWIAATRNANDGGAHILVPPGRVAETARELIGSGVLAAHLRASLTRLAIGFGVGAGLGLVYGLLAGMLPSVESLFAPTFHAVRQVPSIAFIPMLILMFGVEETFKIVVVAKSTFFPIALATVEAVRGVPRSFLEVARVYRVRRLNLVRFIVLPAIVPPVVTGFRIALGRSWMVLVAAEILAAESGLGQMMERGRQMFRLDVVLVGVLFTSTAGIVIERGMRLVERRLGRWRHA
jgi:sulfonate transport system permease protein